MGTQLETFQGVIVQAENQFTGIVDNQKNNLVYETEAMYAMQSLKKNDYLLKCKPDTLMDAIINVASIGLSLNPATKFAYLVPRKGTVCLDISYRGLVQIASSNDSIQWAKATLVYANDDFKFHDFTKMPTHNYDPFSTERGEINGGYCVAKLNDGSFMVEAMNMQEIYKIRDCSMAKTGPWKTWPEEMMKKTLIKRAAKSWPLCTAMAIAEQVINEHQGLSPEELNPVADVEAVRLITDVQGNELNELLIASCIRPERVYKAYSIEMLADLPAERFEECREKFNNAINSHNAKAEQANQ